jgi:hypothetical protein
MEIVLVGRAMTLPSLTNNSAHAATGPHAATPPPDAPLPAPTPQGFDIIDQWLQHATSRVLWAAFSGYSTGWCQPATLLCMICGFLSGKCTLQQTIDLARTGILDRFLSLLGLTRPFSRFLQGTISTGNYATARVRLSLEWVQKLFRAQGDSLSQILQPHIPKWKNLQVFLMDGTNLTVRPHKGILKKYNQAANQLGNAYWCKIRMTISVCLHTGLAMGAVLGNTSVSEQVQAVDLFLQWHKAHPAAHGTVLWMGDANFGIWRIFATLFSIGQYGLCRVSPRAAKSLAKRNGILLRTGMDQRVTWLPSRNDKCQGSIADCYRAVTGRLIYVRVEYKGYRPIELALFTTLSLEQASVEEILALYKQRWAVELCIRHLKIQMGLKQLEVKSAEVAQKVVYAGMMAHNLVRATMCQACQASGPSNQPAAKAQADQADQADRLDEKHERAQKRKVEALSFSNAKSELFWILVSLKVADEGPKAAKEAESKAKAESKAEASDRLQAIWELMLWRINANHLRRRQKKKCSEPRLKAHQREKFGPLKGSRDAARAASEAKRRQPCGAELPAKGKKAS